MFGFLAEVDARSEVMFRNEIPEYFDNMPVDTKEKCKYIISEALRYTDICISIVKEHEDYYHNKDFDLKSSILYRIAEDRGMLYQLEYLESVNILEEYIPEEGNGLKLLCEIRELFSNIMTVISQDVITNEWINYSNQLIIHMSALLHTIDDARDTISS